MESLQNLNPKTLAETLKKNGKQYLTTQEQTEVKKALLIYSASNNENIPIETILVWVEDFTKRGFTLKEVLFIIERAKDVKKFGATTWQTFIEAMQEENYLYNESDMLEKAREMAEKIYQNKLQADKKLIEIENEANKEFKISEENLKEFTTNQKYREQYVNKAINKVLNSIEARLELTNPYNFKTIIASERKSEL